MLSNICIASQINALILYDATEYYGWNGYSYATFLANLLGHFDTTIKVSAIESYTTGQLENYSITFYLGSNYNSSIPTAFLYDVLHTRKTVVWLHDNIWQLNAAELSQKYGFTFSILDNDVYDMVRYNNELFSRNSKNVDLAKVVIEDPSKATVVATALKQNASAIPYIIHSDNFWYVADIPFTYINENDRYLVFADLLYDILQIPAIPQKRALLRLEDIDPTYDTEVLKTTADYLFAHDIPFAVAVIPYYKDPLAYYPTTKELSITQAPEFIEALQYLQDKGGTLLLHGYTHQYDKANPYTGVSAEDYEFYRVIVDNVGKYLYFAPVEEDSTEWVAARVNAAVALMEKAGFTVSIWETPHYAASAIDYQYFATYFGTTIGRILYFDNATTPHVIGQFFPYVIQKDVYGQKVIPENLGCVTLVTWHNFPVHTVEDIVFSAKKNLSLRDAWASMYYHPYLGLQHLQQLVQAIQNMGYKFVALSPDLS